jgi:hypothetical protein
VVVKKGNGEGAAACARHISVFPPCSRSGPNQERRRPCRGFLHAHEPFPASRSCRLPKAWPPFSPIPEPIIVLGKDSGTPTRQRHSAAAAGGAAAAQASGKGNSRKPRSSSTLFFLCPRECAGHVTRRSPAGPATTTCLPLRDSPSCDPAAPTPQLPRRPHASSDPRSHAAIAD